MARQSAIFTPGGLVELNETGTRQSAVGTLAEMNETIVVGGGGGGFTSNFRRTLSPIGGRVGARQAT